MDPKNRTIRGPPVADSLLKPKVQIGVHLINGELSQLLTLFVCDRKSQIGLLRDTSLSMLLN